MDNWPVVIAGGDTLWWLQFHKDLAPWASFFGTMGALALTYWNGRAGDRKETRDRIQHYTRVFEKAETALVSIGMIRVFHDRGSIDEYIDTLLTSFKDDMLLSNIDVSALHRYGPELFVLDVQYFRTICQHFVDGVEIARRDDGFEKFLMQRTYKTLRVLRPLLKQIGRVASDNGVRLRRSPTVPTPIFLRPTLWVALTSRRYQRHSRRVIRKKLHNTFGRR